MANSKRGPKGPMTDEHKEALAQGRTEGRAVRNYLDALRAHKPRRGRKRTAESVQRRLDEIEELLPDADPVAELLMIQERTNLQDELAGMTLAEDLTEIEDAFVKIAASYSQRQGVSYATWREVGVTPAVLRRAGLTRAQ